MCRSVPPAAFRLLAALALLLALACPGAPAHAAHGPRRAEPPPPPYRMPSGGPAAAHAHPPVAKPPGATAAPAAPAKPAPVVVPAAPPPAPVLPPPIVVPTRPTPPPAPPTVAPDAPGAASRTGNGLRVTFGLDRADLNPASDAAITALAHAAPGPDSTFTVTAYAAGGDDPSTPRRLSLSRALAVRSALMHAGIASVKIYVKALGAAAPAMAEGPPDRVDIVVSAAPVPAPPAPPAGTDPAATPPGQAPTAPAPTEKAAP